MPKIQTLTDDATQLAEIKEQQAWIDKLAEKVETAKEALKETRDEWQVAVERLGCIIRDSEDERPLLNANEE